MNDEPEARPGAGGEEESEEGGLSGLLAPGATWGGRERRGAPRAQPQVAAALAPPAPAEPAPTEPAPAPAPAPEPAPAEPAAGDPYRWRKPEEAAKSGLGAEPAERQGLLKRPGSGSSFVIHEEEAAEEKPKRRGLFARGEKLKVERPKAEREEQAPTPESRLVRSRAGKVSRLRMPVKRHHIAVISGAGGTGKTTSAVMLGWLFSEARDGGVGLLEAMPAGGGVAHRLGVDLEYTSADLFRIADYVKGLQDIQAVTHRFAKLEVLGTSAEPSLADILDPGEHERVLALLVRNYPLLVSDTETGLLAPRTTTTLEYADQIVFCMTTDVGATWRASATLGWLLHQGGEAAELARKTVVVAHEMHPGTAEAFEVAKEQISSRCRAVLTIPYDPQFAAGGALDLASVADPTYDAYLDVAVELSHEFGVIAR